MSKVTTIKTTNLPQAFLEVHPHNLYLYCKAYASGLRANTAQTKNRSAVRGGGKKPWAQKGGGRARAGSKRSPIFVGGGVAFGPSTNRNYDLKVNKKQKKLALYHALAEKAANDTLFVTDSITVESGKTKDASAFVNSLKQRDVLVVKEMIDDKTFLAFRNLQNAYLIEANEFNAYLAAAYHSIVIEKAVFDKLTKEA
ncbi:MAG: 50S ribosomal protein L4 [Sulfurovum sp.]|nr:50S ribosomal protein L4 [Sulfurovum sp.]MCB4744936.1 50S ribosomal protein L4 [Sulfurovum sp.]MCB4746061.1 50S ribosomal protein L4 [Sulfurovum sp.]MCB4748212.1 50S ribosomal protein L4 [Sulfurovum sp.]MCB4749651.1 50S ribosomal protein L4 [Sulfurovum sp.]